MKIVGECGTAEPIPLKHDSGPKSACLAAWLCFLPGQSPAWEHYMISVIHLRPVDGQPPNRIDYPGAEHELILVALDSGHNPRADDEETLMPLTPINFEQQFDGVGDDGAVQLCELAAQALVRGVLPAEPDFQFQKDAWRDSMRKTIQHMKTGGHQ